MRKLPCLALAALLALPAAAKPTYVLMDPEGERNAYALGINAHGAVIGEYGRSNEPDWRGFIGYPDGTVVTFTAMEGFRTTPLGINDSGQIVGRLESLGFLREPDGTTTLIQYPNATFTEIRAINNHGDAAGTYERNERKHGFIRDADGGFLSFDGPGENQDTVTRDMNDAGQIAGNLVKGEKYSGFFRDADGSIAAFDAPHGHGHTMPTAIGADGTIVGYYAHKGRRRFHSFIRYTDGTILEFDPPGAKSSFAGDINGAGIVVGNCSKDNGGSPSFMRKPDGSFEFFSFRGKKKATSLGANAINDAGMIAGNFFTRRTSRAFLRLP